MADTNKLSTFLDSNKLNPKRLLAVSHKLETLQRDDRTIKLGKRQGKKAATPAPRRRRQDEVGEAALGSSRDAARARRRADGRRPISGPTKQRILRAVNYLLEQKKKDKVELKTLF